MERHKVVYFVEFFPPRVSGDGVAAKIVGVHDDLQSSFQ